MEENILDEANSKNGEKSEVKLKIHKNESKKKGGEDKRGDNSISQPIHKFLENINSGIIEVFEL